MFITSKIIIENKKSPKEESTGEDECFDEHKLSKSHNLNLKIERKYLLRT